MEVINEQQDFTLAQLLLPLMFIKHDSVQLIRYKISAMPLLFTGFYG